MGDEIVDQIKCRTCGKENKILAWRRLDVQKKPWIKQQILNWEFFYSTCPKCGAKTDFFYTTTYFDRYDKVILRTFTAPLPTPNHIPFPMPPPAVPYTARFAFRDVVGWREMREKILIFSLGINDFQVEFIKFILQIQHQLCHLEFVSACRGKWMFRNRAAALPHQEYIIADTRDYRKQLDFWTPDYLHMDTYLHVDIILIEKIVQELLSRGS